MSEIQLSPEDQDILPVFLCPRKHHNKPDGSSYMEVHKWVGPTHASRKKMKVSRLVLSRIIGRSLSGFEYADHINGDTLDNRRENLRVTTSLQNKGNQQSHIGTSKYKGVYWNKDRRKWRAQFSLPLGNRKYARLNLGNYISEDIAACVYNSIAAEWYGEYARLNNVERS